MNARDEGSVVSAGSVSGKRGREILSGSCMGAGWGGELPAFAGWLKVGCAKCGGDEEFIICRSSRAASVCG